MICVWLKVLMIDSFSFLNHSIVCIEGYQNFVSFCVSMKIVFHMKFTFSALPLC